MDRDNMDREAFTYLRNMFTEFKELNKNPISLQSYDYTVMLEFWSYIQIRLNTCLGYLNNRQTCESLGVNYDDVFREAQVLSLVCGKINIPGAVKTNDPYHR